MTLEGIDVSTYQGAVDWNAVAARYAFAFAKVTEGAGRLNTGLPYDDQWPRNAAALSAPGPLIPGAYHFARPDLGNSPEAEANWFWQWFTDRVSDPHGWLLALDLEVGIGNLSSWRDRFCSRLSSLTSGYTPGWYTYWNFALAHGLNVATPYWGWFAWPDANGALPPAAFSISFQQFGSDSLTGGDADRFFGDAFQLAALTVGYSPPPPKPEVETMVIRNPADGAVYVVGETGKRHIAGLEYGAWKQTPGYAEVSVDTATVAEIPDVGAPPAVDVNALATALATHPLTATLSDAERDAVATHVLQHLSKDTAVG